MRNFLFCLLLLLVALSLHSQQLINGKVKSTDNDSSLAGVSVSVKGTSIGTVTDGAGNFNLQVSSLPVTLVITHTGFASQEIIVRAKESTRYYPGTRILIGARLLLLALQDRKEKFCIHPPLLSSLVQSKL